MLKHAISRRSLLVWPLAGASGLAGTGARGARPPSGRGAAGRQRGRDPFRPPEGSAAAPRPPGLAGVAIMEAMVRGILRFPEDREGNASGLGLVILEGSGKGFVAGPGDRLFDGVIGRVEDDGVVFLLEGDPDRPVFRGLADAATAGNREGR